MVDGPCAGQDGHFFLAINVAAFQDVDAFEERVDRIVREIRDSRRAAGVERLYAPGEIEAETEARYRTEGIPLAAATLNDLTRVASDLGVSASALG